MSRSMNFIRKIVAWLVVMLILYISALVFYVADFFERPAVPSREHPVYWKPRVVVPYMFMQLDSTDQTRFERAWFYFYGVEESDDIREKMLEWISSSDQERHRLAYRYFSRNNLDSDRVRDISCVGPENYDLFVHAWNSESSPANLFVLAEIFCLSDIPCNELSTNMDLKALYLQMIPMLRGRANDDEIIRFKKHLEGVDEETRQTAEALLRVVKEKRNLFWNVFSDGNWVSREWHVIKRVLNGWKMYAHAYFTADSADAK